MCLPPPHPILRGGAHAPLPSNKYILKQQREDFVREWGEEREYRERGTGHVKVIFLILIHYILQNLFAKTKIRIQFIMSCLNHQIYIVI